MATAYIGLGVVTSVDAKTIALVTSSKPPVRERYAIPVATLDASLEVELPGLEKISEFEFDLVRDPDDTNQSSLWTLFGTKATVANVVTFTDATPATWTFNGWVKKIEHETIEHNKTLMWKVTISRNGAITVA